MTQKILFLAANPVATERLALDEEVRQIERKLRATRMRDELELQSAWAVRPGDLLELFNQHRPQIVHFSGHGAGAILILQGEHGSLTRITTSTLEKLFKIFKDHIRLVVLNACFSRQQANVLRKHIDCVIGMQTAIGDEAAATFSAALYSAIGFGCSVKQAYEQGLVAIALAHIPEDDTPRLLVKKGVDADQIILVPARKNCDV